MTLVAICGDWHGDADFANGTLLSLKAQGIEEILHCGDFGYGWDKQYLPTVQKMLIRNGQNLRWVPGNHENYDYIDVLYSEDRQQHTDNMYVLQRGERFTIGKTSFVGIGGAFSIDKQWRRPHVSWWPQETLKYSDIMRILETDETCDVVIAHDAPLTADLQLENGYKDDPETYANREMLQVAVDHLEPEYIFHGHYHQRHDTEDHFGRKVIGLGSNLDKRSDNYVIFDTERKEVVHEDLLAGNDVHQDVERPEDDRSHGFVL